MLGKNGRTKTEIKGRDWRNRIIFEEHLRDDTPPETPRSAAINITLPQINPSLKTKPSVSSSSRLESGRKRSKKNSERLCEENKKLVRKLEKHKKYVQRSKDVKSKNNTTDSEKPKRKVKKIITEANSKEIEKCIIFGEVIKKPIKESFKGAKSKKKLKEIFEVLTGKIARKYKCLQHIRSIT